MENKFELTEETAKKFLKERGYLVNTMFTIGDIFIKMDEMGLEQDPEIAHDAGVFLEENFDANEGINWQQVEIAINHAKKYYDEVD